MMSIMLPLRKIPPWKSGDSFEPARSIFSRLPLEGGTVIFTLGGAVAAGLSSPYEGQPTARIIAGTRRCRRCLVHRSDPWCRLERNDTET